MGTTKHPLYSAWNSMKQRCFNPNNHAFKYYGGRGITVCERWRQNFVAFAQDMGARPAGFTLERINNDGNYEPSNCRWASRREQMYNVRRARKVTICGIEYVAAFLADLVGMKTETIIERAQTCNTLEEVLDPKRKIFWAGLAMTPNSRSRTHCNFGHEYDEQNTYWTPGGYRQCRICNYRRDRERRQRQRERG